MSAKEKELADYWSVYWAINKQRIKSTREFVDKKSGEKMSYEFTGASCMNGSIFMQVFAATLWLSPVVLIIIVSALYLRVCPYSLFVGIACIIAYHFAAMYYIIRGPHLIITSVKKKGIFSRK